MPLEDYIGLHIAIGMSGSGKTYGIRSQITRAVYEGLPVVALDQMFEWGSVDRSIGPLTAGWMVRSELDAGNLRAQIENALRSNRRLIIIRPDTQFIDRAAEEVCAWARDRPGPKGIAIPEAHSIAPAAGKLPPALMDLATRWRHRKLAGWFDTQRFALLNKTLIENAHDVRLYAIVGHRDLQVVHETGGRDLVAKVSEAAQCMARGESGWHVRLGLARFPPYELTRES